MITVDNVTKSYGSFTAVDDVTFTAEPGRITGFLGPNGAGKSTTLRVVVGLTPPDRGAAHVLGRRFAELPNPGLEVGVLLDASAQHAGRTGREVLTIAQRTMGLRPRRVDETLEQVGLTSAEAGRRLRDYSLGMRQRLGLAHALLGDPEVLILDEPANGLDPAGIRWMRDLLRGYADRGATVLLSSHLLHEIEVVADDLVVIGRGQIVAAGTKADLLAGAGTEVLTRHHDQLAHALTAAGLDHSYVTTPAEATTRNTAEPSPHRAQPHRLRVDAETEAVGRLAHEAGVALIELRGADGAGLEEMFLELTADTQRDSHDASTAGVPSYQEGAVA
jgi:ABC-2 type transport system ATP-binding protein